MIERGKCFYCPIFELGLAGSESAGSPPTLTLSVWVKAGGTARPATSEAASLLKLESGAEQQSLQSQDGVA